MQGRPLYAVGHVGWIGPDQWPMPLTRERIPEEFAAASRLMEAVPELKEYYLVRPLNPDPTLTL